MSSLRYVLTDIHTDNLYWCHQLIVVEKTEIIKHSDTNATSNDEVSCHDIIACDIDKWQDADFSWPMFPICQMNHRFGSKHISSRCNLILASSFFPISLYNIGENSGSFLYKNKNFQTFSSWNFSYYKGFVFSFFIFVFFLFQIKILSSP